MVRVLTWGLRVVIEDEPRFVSELRKAQVAESEGPTDSASHGDASSTKPKQE